MNQKYDRSVIYWLLAVSFMVLLMVFIGGVTRLTDSGLSIVDWKPIMGAIPPLSELEWNQVFDKYKQFPEYKIINYGMTLSEFKFIFFWEYFHRLMGRMVGVVFFFPFLYFLVRGRITGYRFKLLIAFLLGGAQGVLGWYMVKSGLVLKPDVSHFRLAAHLGLAFVIIGYIFWVVFDMLKIRKAQKPQLVLGLSFLALLSLQIVYGAFVAGLDAGLSFNTFPMMGSKFIATPAISGNGLFYDFFYNPVMIQFIHRTLGILIFFFAVWIMRKAYKTTDLVFRKAALHLCLPVFLQVFLGIATLVLSVPLVLASAHQVLACVVFVLAIKFIYISE